jgi:hypothetical protein
MKIELKNIKHAAFASQETECFTATVYIDGQRCGEVSNEGHGGCNSYHPHDLHDKLNAYAATLPDVDVPTSGPKPLTIKQDADILVGDILADELERRQLKRLCGRSTLFRLKSETYQRGEWRTVKARFSPDVRAHLARKYGADIAEILNETLNGSKQPCTARQ